MRLFVFMTCAMIALTGCGNETEEQNAQLQTENQKLSQELTSRDQYIEEVTTAINEIHIDVEAARSKERTLLAEADEIEGSGRTQEDVRGRILGQIAAIDTTLDHNRQKLSDLEERLKNYSTQFSGLNMMVKNLQATLSDREASIAHLESRVMDLEGEVATQSQLMAEQDSTIKEHEMTISRQTSTLNTGYYIVGTRDELEEKGVIDSQGGFLWGLLGSTTVLSTGVDRTLFHPIDKTSEKSIQVNGHIDEIVPKRSENLYEMKQSEGDLSVIEIVEPENFWLENVLVIITD